MPWSPATTPARLPMTSGRHEPSLATNELLQAWGSVAGAIGSRSHHRSARRFPPSPRARLGQPTYPNALGAEQIGVFGTTL